MIDGIKKLANDKMKKSIESIEKNLMQIRTGRASVNILDNIMVPCYGSNTPLKQVVSISLEDSRTLLLNVFDKSLISAVEKAIIISDLGLNPATSGTSIRVPMPSLTEETRKKYTKQAKTEVENGKIAIRNIRREALNQLKEKMKSKEISEDDEKRATDEIQKLTDKEISIIDKLFEVKEKELMSF